MMYGAVEMMDVIVYELSELQYTTYLIRWMEVKESVVVPWYVGVVVMWWRAVK